MASRARKDPAQPTRRFRPDSEWIRSTLIQALRYKENRGVRWLRGAWFEERVQPRTAYVWTTDTEIARRKEAGIALPRVTEPEALVPIPWAA